MKRREGQRRELAELSWAGKEFNIGGPYTEEGVKQYFAFTSTKKQPDNACDDYWKLRQAQVWLNLAITSHREGLRAGGTMLWDFYSEDRSRLLMPLSLIKRMVGPLNIDFFEVLHPAQDMELPEAEILESYRDFR